MLCVQLVQAGRSSAGTLMTCYAYHFCQAGIAATIDPGLFVRRLDASFERLLPQYASIPKCDANGQPLDSAKWLLECAANPRRNLISNVLRRLPRFHSTNAAELEWYARGDETVSQEAGFIVIDA